MFAGVNAARARLVAFERGIRSGAFPATGNLNGVRAATHIYNMPEEVDRLIDAVTHVAKNASRFRSI